MGNALYRKYRSSSLDELIGQEHITKTLKNSLKTGKISHAYLFTGPRGVGKTSVARILAREVNNLPVNTQEHLDIIEIDAASNRRIDEIRDLRDKAQIAPSSAKYKVYIVDEVHMLTKEAFNALLKTLEEPPKHVIFILATTELHKLPETIVSRTQRFTFKPIETNDAVDHLLKIADKEKISIDKEAVSLIAEHGQGSFRDSLSFLDQIRHVHTDGSTKITTDDVASLIGLPPRENIEQLLKALVDNDGQAVLSTIQQLKERGVDATKIASEVSQQLRKKLVASGVIQSNNLTLLRELIDVQGSYDPYGLLELVLLQSITTNNQKASIEPASTSSQSKPAPRPEAAKTPKPNREQPKQMPNDSKPRVEENEQQSKPKEADRVDDTAKTDSIDEAWKLILEDLKGKHNTLYGMARMAIPRLEGDSCVLECKYNFHAKRLSDAHHKSILVGSLTKHLGREVELTCTVIDKKASKKSIVDRPDVVDTTETKNTVETISNIFGDAEVLES